MAVDRTFPGPDVNLVSFPVLSQIKPQAPNGSMEDLPCLSNGVGLYLRSDFRALDPADPRTFSL